MDITQAVEKMRAAPLGTRHDTIVTLWHQLPPGTDLKPLAQAAMESGLDRHEIEAVLRI